MTKLRRDDEMALIEEYNEVSLFTCCHNNPKSKKVDKENKILLDSFRSFNKN